jgi:hypothetical protein
VDFYLHMEWQMKQVISDRIIYWRMYFGMSYVRKTECFDNRNRFFDFFLYKQLFESEVAR